MIFSEFLEQEWNRARESWTRDDVKAAISSYRGFLKKLKPSQIKEMFEAGERLKELRRMRKLREKADASRTK